MWKLLGLVSVVIAVYELWTRPSAADIAAAAANPGAGTKPADNPNARQPGPIGLTNRPGQMPELRAPLPVIGAKAMAKCAITPTDIVDTDNWSLKYLSPQLTLAKRLDLMRSVIAPITWPDYARRVWCGLVAEGLV